MILCRCLVLYRLIEVGEYKNSFQLFSLTILKLFLFSFYKMDTEILTPKSEVDDFQTPHDCQETDNENICQSNLEANDKPNQRPSTSEDTPRSSTAEDKISCEDIKFEEKNTKLEERLKDLKEQIVTLKEQLVEEKIAWQKELEEATKFARVVCVSYSNEQQDSTIFGQDTYSLDLVPRYISDIDNESMVSEPTLSEFSILDYEQKLSTYQEALAKSQYEKRNMLKRQLAANAYKRRLMEVEKLCNMELLKVKQTVQYLQPLQVLASSWDNSAENIMKFDDELTGAISKTQNEPKTPQQSGDENIRTDFMTVEDLENTVFKDLKEFSSQIAATPCGFNLSEADEIIAKTKIMTNFYNNELGSHLPFNPLM